MTADYRAMSDDELREAWDALMRGERITPDPILDRSGSPAECYQEMLKNGETRASSLDRSELERWRSAIRREARADRVRVRTVIGTFTRESDGAWCAYALDVGRGERFQAEMRAWGDENYRRRSTRREEA